MIAFVDVFKAHFFRDFPYLPTYNPEKIYFKGDEVYSAPNFYQSLIDGNTQPVTDKEAWQPIKDDVNNYLSDMDIQKAVDEALLNFNADLFDDNPTDDYIGDRNLALLYLTAFYLVMDIKNAMAGLNSQAYSSFVASKSVGNVSESYGIPSWVANNPMYSLYMDNGYGKKFLSYLIPRVTGWIHLSPGGTTFR